MEQELMNLGLAGLCIVALAKSYSNKDNKVDSLNANNIEIYKETIKEMREDFNKREEALIKALSGLSNTIEISLSKFSDTINHINDSMIEVSTQLGLLGTNINNEVGHLCQRMGDVEHGIDRINEELKIPKIEEQRLSRKNKEK